MAANHSSGIRRWQVVTTMAGLGTLAALGPVKALESAEVRKGRLKQSVCLSVFCGVKSL